MHKTLIKVVSIFLGFSFVLSGVACAGEFFLLPQGSASGCLDRYVFYDLRDLSGIPEASKVYCPEDFIVMVLRILQYVEVKRIDLVEEKDLSNYFEKCI